MSSSVEQVVWEWDQSKEGIDDMKECLVRMGLYIYNNPLVEGSSCDGFIISKNEMTEDQIREKAKEVWPDNEDEDEEDERE